MMMTRWLLTLGLLIGAPLMAADCGDVALSPAWAGWQLCDDFDDEIDDGDDDEEFEDKRRMRDRRRMRDLDDEDFDEGDEEFDEDDERWERELEDVDPEKLLAFVTKNMPLTAKYVNQLSEKQRERLAREQLAKAYFDYEHMAEEESEEATAMVKEYDAELAAHLAGDQVRRLRRGGDKAKLAEAEKSLAEMVAKLFEQRQASMKREIEYLKEEVNELEEVIQEREKNKAMIIKRHRAILSGKPDPFDF